MRARITISLARKFLRSGSLARSTIIVFATAALTVGMYITLSAFSLSGEQIADRDLGRYSTSAGLAVAGIQVGQAGVTDAVVTAAERSGAQDAAVYLQSFNDVRPPAADGFVVYIEGAWASEPFPHRYSLVTGRWPTEPGEVVISEPLRDQLGSPSSLSVFSGNERFRVVGVTHDRFGSSSRILAAPGTWDSFGSATERNFSTVSASPRLYWNGGDPQRIIAAIAAAVSASEPDISEAELTSQISQSLTTRDIELARDRQTWTERLPTAYLIPSLALPLLSVLTVFGLNGRRLRRSMGVLRSLGVSRASATGSVALATAAWVMISAVAGTVAGIALGAAARPVCEALLSKPISPFPAFGSPVTRLLLLTAASSLLAIGVLHVTARRAPREPRAATGAKPTKQPATRPRRTIGDLRHGTAIVAGCAAIVQVATLDTVPEAMLLAGTVGVLLLLFTPELVAATVRALPMSRPRLRLGRQQLANDRERAVAAVAVLATVLGAPLGMLALLATLISTMEDQDLPAVAPHQLVLNGRGGELHPPQPAVTEAVTGRVEFDQPGIQIGYLWNEDSDVTVQGAGPGEVLAVATVDELARLNNSPLTDAQIETLHNGGMLVWHDSPAGGYLVHQAEEPEPILTTRGPVPAHQSSIHPVWQSTVAAVLLRSTALRLDLPVTDGAIVFTNVSESQAAAAERAVREAGLDTAQVEIHRPSDPIDVPPVFYTAVVGLGAIVLLTTMAVARTQVLTLRGYLGRLVAIGLSPRWARHVLLIQAAVVIGLSTILALLLAIPPIAISAWRLPDFKLAVPWDWLGLTVGAFYAAALLATLLSSRSLRATDRFTL